MLRQVWLIAVGLLVAGLASASMTTCPMGTYSQYLASGFICSSGGLVFQNFGYLQFGLAIPASQVNVIPITTDSNEGFHFQGAWSVSAGRDGGTFQDAQISFDVSRPTPAIRLLQLSFFGSFTGAGSTIVTESFDAPPLGGGLNTATDPLPSQAEVAFFVPVQMVSVTSDIQVSSGGEGAATITDVFETFTTPEPMPFLMVGAGLLWLGLFRKRVRR